MLSMISRRKIALTLFCFYWRFVTVYGLQKVCFNPYKSEKNLCLNDIDYNVMPRLTENQSIHAIGMHQTELAHNIVARHCGVHHNTIQSLLMRFG